MHFTRDPIIETVITPREGCKLVVRSSKGLNQEDFFVDAVEVVSFGHSFFYRSLEKPQSFFVPVSDYELLEVKETRMMLKSAPLERKVVRGRGEMGGQASTRSRDEGVPEEGGAVEGKPEGRRPPSSSEYSSESVPKRERRRRGRRGGRDRALGNGEGFRGAVEKPLQEEEFSLAEEEPLDLEGKTVTAKGGVESLRGGAEPAKQEPVSPEPKAPPFISKLFPPPTTLIKDSLSRAKSNESSQQGGTPSVKTEGPEEERTLFEGPFFESSDIPVEPRERDEQKHSEE